MSRALAKSERKPLDAYYTPDDVALACVQRMARAPEGGWVIEPSVGGGAFVRASRLVWPGARVLGVDLDPDASGLADCDDSRGGTDWTRCWTDSTGSLHKAADSVPLRRSIVVGNPPYGAAQEHIEHALALEVRAVGFLLRLAFLEGQGRAAFWRTHPPESVHVLRKRPSFTGGGTDATAYAFFVWQRGFMGSTRLDWIEP